MKKIGLFILGFFIGIILFMPKDNLYFTLQKYLAKEKVYINSDIKNGIFLSLNNGKIFVNGMNLANFDKVKAGIFLLFNEIKAKNIKIKFNNLKINALKITYSIINPTNIIIQGDANFGKIEGKISLTKKRGKIYILKLTNANLKSFLKKDNKGYYYNVSF